VKNSKSIRVYTFVFVLMLILLHSSMIGTTVWAKSGKPDKPGKPPSEPEKFDYQIWIGNRPLGSLENLVLQSYGELDHLVVENVSYSGRWLPPPTKGKKSLEGWSVSLKKSEGDYCGTYDINKEDLIDVLIANEIYPITDKAVFRFYIQHRLSENADYWFILIDFELGTFGPVPGSDPPVDAPHLLMLVGKTDTGLELDGEYDETTDTWTVYFNDAWFRVTENTESGEIEELWTGQLSFTVKIKRTLCES
jgi:hypothetical protein